MSLAGEAAYLYGYSKELVKINKRLHSLSKDAEKHKERHGEAEDEDKQKHFKRHKATTQDISSLIKKRKQIFNSITHHQFEFERALKKQHHL